MTKIWGTTAVFGGLFSFFIILPAIAPVHAEAAASTSPTEFITASGRTCAEGEVPDNSTAAQTLQKIEALGYADVEILEKGCDNFWRATGFKGGQRRNLAVSPDGGVAPGNN